MKIQIFLYSLLLVLACQAMSDSEEDYEDEILKKLNIHKLLDSRSRAFAQFTNETARPREEVGSEYRIYLFYYLKYGRFILARLRQPTSGKPEPIDQMCFFDLHTKWSYKSDGSLYAYCPSYITALQKKVGLEVENCKLYCKDPTPEYRIIPEKNLYLKKQN